MRCVFKHAREVLDNLRLQEARNAAAHIEAHDRNQVTATLEELTLCVANNDVTHYVLTDEFIVRFYIGLIALTREHGDEGTVVLLFLIHRQAEGSIGYHERHFNLHVIGRVDSLVVF